MISIIVRTKNEERWISLCLKAINEQDYKDFEIIVVDNKSTDATLAKVKAFSNIKVLSIDEYLPGKALNLGIKASGGEFICCLSGHCIPVNNQWLSNLIKNFDDKQVAGVYGRQEPMAYTSDLDKRDLLNIFGLDRKIQIKDSFFHNANSMIRRDVWEKFPFNENVTNIEDRVWAKEVLKHGYKIVYEPGANVYHHHGIHQDNNTERCYNVVRILESLGLRDENKNAAAFDIKKLNVAALIPVKGAVQYLNKRPLIEYTIERCKQSEFIKDIVVSTDNPELAKLAEKSGAKVPFMRTKELSSDYIELENVLQFSLEQMERKNIMPDVVVVLEITYPFRSKGLLDSMITRFVSEGLDSVIAGRPEYKSCWLNTGRELKRVDEGFIPRALKQPFYIGLVGLGCVTYPVFIREGQRLGKKVGILEVLDPHASIEVRDEIGFNLAGEIIGAWWEQNK